MTDDGEIEDIATTGSVRWRSIADTIVALEPTRIEAHGNGRLLRAQRLGESDDSHGRVSVTQSRSNQSEDDEELLRVPAVLHTDPETARLTHFANLLFRSTQFSQQIAFREMVKLVEVLMTRMQDIEIQKVELESALEDESAARLEDAYQNLSATATDPQRDILSTFMEMAASRPTAPKNGKPS
jgi:hypothetical protein